jgi:glycerate kinase
VFGPQKGADPAAVAELEAGLIRWRRMMEKATGWKIGGPGTGAAGGMVVGLAGLLGDAGTDVVPGTGTTSISDVLERGFELVAGVTGLDSRMNGVDLILTSEGRLDASSLMGKTVGGLLDRAELAGIPVIAVPGSVSSEEWPGRDRFAGITALVDAVGIREAMSRPGPALEEASRHALENWLGVNQAG